MGAERNGGHFRMADGLPPGELAPRPRQAAALGGRRPQPRRRRAHRGLRSGLLLVLPRRTFRFGAASQSDARYRAAPVSRGVRLDFRHHRARRDPCNRLAAEQSAQAEAGLRSDGMDKKNDYDRFARVYSEDAEHNAFNALYERPEALRLMGDVAGLKVLDAGCGSGAHAAALRSRGAIVTGIDKSSGMLALARERFRDDVAL